MMPLKLKDLIGPVVALVAVIAGILQYRSTSKDDFIKPVREAQLKLYQEASSAAAQIATLQRGTPEWTKSYQEFVRLYYGPMAIVEDFEHVHGGNDKKLTVEDAMVIFKSCVDDEELCKRLEGDLLDLSLALAHTCRESLGRSWGYDVKQLEGDYQQIAMDYRDKLAKESVV